MKYDLFKGAGLELSLGDSSVDLRNLGIWREREKETVMSLYL